MVNAILRRFLREREAWLAQAQENEVARYNHPQWLIDLLKAQYPNDWQAILRINNSHPPMTLRVNTQQYSVRGIKAYSPPPVTAANRRICRHRPCCWIRPAP